MNGCANFHAALKQAHAALKSLQYKNILIVVFDQAKPFLQRVYDLNEDFIYLTSDACSSCLVSVNKRNKNCQFLLDSDIEFRTNVNFLNGFESKSFDDELYEISNLFNSIYNSYNVSSSDIDYLITNNYSQLISQVYAINPPQK